jgi:hypothetical protein
MRGARQIKAYSLGDSVRDRWAVYIDIEGFRVLYDRERRSWKRSVT